MQRWMQAKMQRARVNGIAISGAGRPMGSVSEDRPIGATKEAIMFKPVTEYRKPAIVLKVERPKAWGATKKTKRAAHTAAL